MLSFLLPDEAATATLAHRLAAVAAPGDVLTLAGTLGMGKTAFARAFIRALTTPDEDVPSPTFTLVQTYDTRCAPLWHCDLYRLENPDDLMELGLDDALQDGILLIEWPDRAGPYLPPRRVSLHLTQEMTGGLAETARQATLDAIGGSDWLARFDAGRACRPDLGSDHDR